MTVLDLKTVKEFSIRIRKAFLFRVLDADFWAAHTVNFQTGTTFKKASVEGIAACVVRSYFNLLFVTLCNDFILLNLEFNILINNIFCFDFEVSTLIHKALSKHL